MRSLVSFLETESKLALRLVCTSTAEWVTTKEFLGKLKVPIGSDDDMLRIMAKENCLSSEDNFKGWSNLYLQQDLMQYNQSVLVKFFAGLHHLQTLQLSRCSAKCDLWKTLSNLTNLKHLTIDDLDISNSSDEALIHDGPLDKGKYDVDLHKLRLTTFSVKQLTFSRPSDLRAWLGIFKLMTSGTTKFITIPKPQYVGDNDREVTWSDVKTLQWVLITEPILALMEDTFAINGRKITLDVKHLVPIHFGRLVERCMNMNRNGFNFYFINVHANHVKYVFLLSGDDGEEEFLERILSLNEKIDDRRNLRRWTGLEKICIRSSRCDVRNYHDYLDDATIIFPKLKIIEIEFDSKLQDDPGFLALHRVIDLLFKVKRARVREVVLKFNQHFHDVPMDVVDLDEIKANCCNMQKLVLVSLGVSKRIV